MKFHPTPLNTAKLIELTPFEDERGSFARTFCQREFEDAGLPTEWVQQNVSRSRDKGSIRGMHFQKAPYTEDKLVRCLKGRILDVIIDLRADSPTYLRHHGFELTEDSGTQLFVPQGFAHGFQALTDDVIVTYLVTNFYTPEAERGVRHDDPVFAIEWPETVTTVSQKDQQWPLQELDSPVRV